MQKTLVKFHTAQYDAETQAVARLAKEYQKQQPDLSWSECIRIAEKNITGVDYEIL